MQKIFLLMGMLLIPIISIGQTLDIVIPDNANTKTTSKAYRYAGHTEIGNKVKVNGVETKVYPNGAFVGLFTLETGQNIYTFEASTPTGPTKSKTITVFRNPPSQPIPETEIKLDNEGISPNEDQVLMPGDILHLQVKGTPDAKVSATIEGLIGKIDLTEIPVDSPNGIKGIYGGTYRVQAGDKITNSAVTFTLIKESTPGQPISAGLQTKAKITVDTKSWPKVGFITTTRDAYLNVGLGEARLGGAQYGFLPISTKLVLDGTMGNQYRVKLDPTLHAYIPKSFVQELPDNTKMPASYVGVPTLESNNKFDSLLLDTNERLPFIVETFATLPLLRIHIFGVTSNFTWITSKVPLALIRDITWEQVADGHIQIDLHLSEPVKWGYDVDYPNGGKELRVKIFHKPVLAKTSYNPLQGLTIAIDAGHGGSNSGAIGAMGIYEKFSTWAMANYLKSKLEAQGVKVVMTRLGADESVAMSTRVERTEAGNPDLLISIHCNSIGDTTDPLKTRGTMVFYKYPFNHDMGYAILKKLETIPGFSSAGLVSNFNFALGKLSGIPSILVETAYLSHPEEEAIVISETGRQQVAQSIVDGLTDYFNTVR